MRAFYPQHVVDNLPESPNKRLILLCGTNLMDRFRDGGGFPGDFDPSIDEVSCSRAAEVPGAPISPFGVSPPVLEILLDHPAVGLAHAGQRLDKHGCGVGAKKGQVVGV